MGFVAFALWGGSAISAQPLGRYEPPQPVHGVVLAPEGTLAAGVEVVADWSVDEKDPAFTRDLVIRDAGAAVLYRTRPENLGFYPLVPTQQEPRRTTRSDEKGQFALDVIPCGALITAEQPGTARAVARFSCNDSPVQLQLEPAVHLNGVVKDGAGELAPGATVQAVRRADGYPIEWASASSHENGSFLLENLLPGFWKLTVERGEGPALQLELEIRKNEPLAPITLRFPPAGSITGRVANLSLEEIRDIELLLDGEASASRLGQDGRFRIDGVPQGGHEITALRRSTEQFSDPATAEITHHGEVVHVELRFPERATLSGVAQCAGRGAPGLRVEIYGPDSQGTTADDQGAWKLEDIATGYYSIDYLDPQNQVIARQDAYLDSDLSLLTDLPCHLLAGVVRTPGGFPIPGADITVAAASSLQTVAARSSDSAGEFRFAELPPGRYSVTASVGGQESEEIPVELVESVDDIRIILDIRKGLDLLVFEPDGTPARRIWVQPMRDVRLLPPLTADCNDQGLCHLEDLDFGAYGFMVRGWDGARLFAARVPSDVIELPLLPTGVLEIRQHPDTLGEQHFVRVVYESSVPVPPRSFVNDRCWQPVNGLVTVEIPAGHYDVYVVDPEGESNRTRVKVFANQRAAVEIEPDPPEED